MDIINSGQKKLLRRMAVYPIYTSKAIISIAVCLGIAIFGSMAIFMKYSTAINEGCSLVIFAIVAAMMIVFVYTMISVKSIRRQSELNDIRELAIAGTSDEALRKTLRNGDARMLCDYFRIDYSRNKSTLVTVISIVVCMVSFFGAFYIASSDYARTVKSVNAVHQAIQDTFKDVLVLKYRDDPEKIIQRYSYSICLEDKENPDKGDVYINCTTDGKIESVSFTYNMDTKKSSDEKLKDAENWIANVSPKLSGVKASYFIQPEFANFKYTMSQGMKNSVHEDPHSDQNSNYTDGMIRVYEHYYVTYSDEYNVWLYAKKY